MLDQRFGSVAQSREEAHEALAAIIGREAWALRRHFDIWSVEELTTLTIHDVLRLPGVGWVS